MRLEFKLDVFNIFNHTNFIGNDSNDNIAALSLPTLGPNFGCANATTKDCKNGFLNPYTGLYIGANGVPLTTSVFRSGRPDKNLVKTNWNSLGDPASDTAPGALNRVMQVAVRIRF